LTAERNKALCSLVLRGTGRSPIDTRPGRRTARAALHAPVGICRIAPLTPAGATNALHRTPVLKKSGPGIARRPSNNPRPAVASCRRPCPAVGAPPAAAIRLSSGSKPCGLADTMLSLASRRSLRPNGGRERNRGRHPRTTPSIPVVSTRSQADLRRGNRCRPITSARLTKIHRSGSGSRRKRRKRTARSTARFAAYVAHADRY
jgi:hypothetical protein